jgi:CRP-like cAMP-binding protein
MGIDARAESSFEIDNYQEHNEKLQITNFFLGLLCRLPLKNAEVLAEKLWEVLVKIQEKDERHTLRKDIIFKLTKIGELTELDEQCLAINQLLRLLAIDLSFQTLIKNREIIIEACDVEILKPHTASFKVNAKEKVVFGAAPEFIKTFLNQGEHIPEYVVLSGQTFKEGINFAEIEFAIYDNFFYQQGRKVKIICTEEQEERLRIILEVSIHGPDFDTLLATETHEAKRQEYQKLKSFRDLLIPRDKTGKMIEIDGYVEFIHFQNKIALITLTESGEKIYIHTSKKNPDAFLIKNSREEIIGYVDLASIHKDEFSFPVERKPLTRDEFGVFVLDSGDGFSPDKHTSSFLLWLEGKPLLVDPMAYSDLYLKRKGIDSNEIIDIFISHNHGDHDQGVYNYLIKGRRIRLIGCEIVIQQTLLKVAAAINSTREELLKLIDIVYLPIGIEVPLPGYKQITAELEYGLHPIPTNMIKFFYKDSEGKTLKTLGYSGDTILDTTKYEEWVHQGKIASKDAEKLTAFFYNTDTIIHEAGEGPIHSVMEQIVKQYPDKVIYWVHTKLKKSDYGQILQSGDHLTFIKEHVQKKIDWYLQIYEKVPLLANLSTEDKYQLARRAVNSQEIEIINYMAGETIIKEGELPKDKSFYIIAQGSVDILQNGYHMASLGVGQQLGEMALFGNNQGRRNATVRAFAGLKLIKIHEQAYEDFKEKIEKAYFQYTEARTFLDTSNSPFKGLNHNILDNIGTRLEKKVFLENRDGRKEALIIKGKQSKEILYLIIEGEVGAVIDKDRKVGFRLGKGAIVGEMSLLDEDLLPTATVVPITKKVIAYTLSRKAFNEIAEKYPPVRFIIEGIAQKRRKMNQEAINSKDF